MATLETITQFLLTKFPALIFAFAAGGFIWFAQSTDRRLDRIENNNLPTNQAQIHYLEIERAKAQSEIDHHDEDMKEYRETVRKMQADMDEMKSDIADMKGDIKLILSKLK